MSGISGIKVCPFCGLKYAPKTTWQIYCTKSCFHLNEAKKSREKDAKKRKRTNS